MINIQADGTPKVYLIDFGFSDKFMSDITGEHIEENEEVKTFRGNLVYSSLRQMKFLKTSRKDDLVSLFYMIVSVVKNNVTITPRNDVSVKD